MHRTAQITIVRPRADVFDYLARSEHLPDYAGDFIWVKQTSTGAPGPGTEYEYQMKRGIHGTFHRSEYTPHTTLAWSGPPAKAGPGSMAPSGRWELADAPGGATTVTLVMSPTPGGLLTLMAPVIFRRIADDLPIALARLREQLEQPVSR